MHNYEQDFYKFSLLLTWDILQQTGQGAAGHMLYRGSEPMYVEWSEMTSPLMMCRRSSVEQTEKLIHARYIWRERFKWCSNNDHSWMYKTGQAKCLEWVCQMQLFLTIKQQTSVGSHVLLIHRRNR